MSPQNYPVVNQPSVPPSSQKIKKILTIIFAAVLIAGALFGIGYSLYHWSKTRLTKEERQLQKMSEEMGKSTFDLDGKIVSVAADGKSLVVKTTATSKTIPQQQDKETKLQTADVIKVVNQEQKDIKITDLKVGNSVNIKGSLQDQNLIAESITLR